MHILDATVIRTDALLSVTPHTFEHLVDVAPQIINTLLVVDVIASVRHAVLRDVDLGVVVGLGDPGKESPKAPGHDVEPLGTTPAQIRNFVNYYVKYEFHIIQGISGIGC